MRTVKTLITCHIVGFVMMQLICSMADERRPVRNSNATTD